MPRRVLPRADGAHGKVAFDGVITQRDGHVVELRRLRRPQMQLLRRDDSAAAAVRVRPAFGDGLALIADGDLRALRRGGEDLPADAPLRQLRGKEQRPDIPLRHQLRPHGLPDAALRRVPDAAALRLLLAAGKGDDVRVVAHGDGQGVLALPQQLRDVKGKGGVAACVRSREQTVDVHPRPLVHCPEVQQRPHARPFFERQRPPVPEHLPRPERLPHAGQRRFRREGDEDLPVPRAGAGVGGRDGIVPQAVERIKALPHELRAGIFLQHLLLVKRFTPACQHAASSFFPKRQHRRQDQQQHHGRRQENGRRRHCLHHAEVHIRRIAAADDGRADRGPEDHRQQYAEDHPDALEMPGLAGGRMVTDDAGEDGRHQHVARHHHAPGHDHGRHRPREEHADEAREHHARRRQHAR